MPALFGEREQRDQFARRVAVWMVACDGEQCLDRLLQPVDLRERALELDRVLGCQLKCFELEAKRCERRAQLVGGVGAEGAFTGDEVCQACRRKFEGLRDRVHLADRGARRADGEVAVAQPRGGIGDALEWASETPAEQDRGEQSERQHGGAEARRLSNGWFDAWAMPGGLDPTGLVKGWATQRAADILQEAGMAAAMVNGAGDIACFGRPEPGRAWTVGIQDPNHPHRILRTIRSAASLARELRLRRSPARTSPSPTR